MVSFNLLGHLPTTARGNAYAFLVVDLFSRHAEEYAITKGEITLKAALRDWSTNKFRDGDAPTPFYLNVKLNLYRRYAEGFLRCWAYK